MRRRTGSLTRRGVERSEGHELIRSPASRKGAADGQDRRGRVLTRRVDPSRMSRAKP